MRIARDMTQRPGVGTLMYMGEEPTRAPSSSMLVRVLAGGVGVLAVHRAVAKGGRGRVGIVDGAIGIGGGIVLLKALIG